MLPSSSGPSQEAEEPVLLRAGLEGYGRKTSKLPLRALRRAELPSPGTGPSQQGGLQRGSCRVGRRGRCCRVSKSPPTPCGAQ